MSPDDGSCNAEFFEAQDNHSANNLLIILATTMATGGRGRPSRLTTTRSFSRYEPPSASGSAASTPTPTRGRASTLSKELSNPEIVTVSDKGSPASSVYEQQEEKEVHTPILKDGSFPPTSPSSLEAFDDLPVEIISLSDR